MDDTNNRLIFNPDYSIGDDLLGFKTHVEVLSKMICAKNFKTPFCIGIYGQWGSGKTTFMRLLEDAVKNCGKDIAEDEKYVIPVWFNPWRYAKEEHLIIPFLKTIQQEIDTYANQNQDTLGAIYDQLKKFATGVGNLADAFLFGVKQEFKFSALGLTLGGSLDNEKVIKRIEDLENRPKTLADDLSSMYYGIVRNLEKLVDDKPFRIIVFIDDLDRCLPKKVVELLEAVKLFLDLPGYLFVIGVDREIVKQGIADYYKHLDKKSDTKESNKESKHKSDKLEHTPDDYLDKMIQLPIELPHIEPDKRKEYIKALLNNDKYGEHADIIDRVIGDNPRALKRFINLLAFTTNLAESLKDRIKDDKDETKKNKEAIEQYFEPLLYVKWALIVFKFQNIHKDIKKENGWETLYNLQSIAVEGKEETKDMDDRLIEILKRGKEGTEEHFFPNNKWVIENFIYLTASAKIQDTTTQPTAGYIRKYQTGDMVLIPKGPFLYGEDSNQIEKNIDYDYYMDVFPVTNAQYQEFINENEKQQVPSGSAKDWASWDKDKRTFPESMANHPVVMVSYKDALVYCKWCSEKEGLKEDEAYRLPTEEEWEKAARGNDGRGYPWGDGFDKGKCNTNESGISKTTPVGNYPQGASPYGCQDMAGNVWEWMDSWYDKDKDARVLRGGSWGDTQGDACCAYRYDINPDSRLNIIGFRLSRTKK